LPKKEGESIIDIQSQYLESKNIMAKEEQYRCLLLF